MLVFFAEPGSASHDGLQLLANWADTHRIGVEVNDPAATNPITGN